MLQTSIERGHRVSGPDGAYEVFCLPPEDLPRGQILEREFGRPQGRTVFTPNTSVHSGRLLPAEAFSHIEQHGSVTLRSCRTPVEGPTFIGVDQGLRIHTAGCPMLVGSGNGYCKGAHAGVKSLIDFGRVATGRSSPNRDYEGIVHAFAHGLRQKGFPKKEAKLRIFFASVPDDFRYPLDHPLHGDFNKKLRKEILALCEGNEQVMREDTGALDVGLLATYLAYDNGFEDVEVSHPISEAGGFATRASNPERNTVGLICT